MVIEGKNVEFNPDYEGSRTIILTDWPKTKTILANLRGVETEELQKEYKEMFHLMMCSSSVVAGGYEILYLPEEIEKELDFRKAEVPCRIKNQTNYKQP